MIFSETEISQIRQAILQQPFDLTLSEDFSGGLQEEKVVNADVVNRLLASSWATIGERFKRKGLQRHN